MAEDSAGTPDANGADTTGAESIGADTIGGVDRPTAAPVALGAVLLGGGSRRMGRDKASLVVDDARLLDRAVAAVRAAVGTQRPVLVVGQPRQVEGAAAVVAADDLPTGSRWVSDLRPDAGPLAGLEAALTAASDAGAQLLLLTGVDHPWPSPAVLQLLADRVPTPGPSPDAAVLGTAGGPLLLLGAYRTTALPTIRGLLDAGERRLQALRDHLEVEVVAESQWRVLDPLGATAIDVDDPSTLAAATRWHRRALATAAHTDGGNQPSTIRTVLDVRPRDSASVGAGDPGGAPRFVAHEREDAPTPEEPLCVRAAGPGQQPVTLTTLLRTPGHDAELAVGWLLCTGTIGPKDVVGTTAEVTVADGVVTTTITVAARHAVDTGAALGTAAPRAGPVTDDAGTAAPGTGPVTDDAGPAPPIPWSVVTSLPPQLRWATGAGTATLSGSGVHSAGLFDNDGRALTVRSDVSRHNALDAVIGAHILAGVWPAHGLDDVICTLSGRVGARHVHAAATAGIPLLVAVGSASALAVVAAEHAGITLVGSLGGTHGTVYTHAHRLSLDR